MIVKITHPDGTVAQYDAVSVDIQTMGPLLIHGTDYHITIADPELVKT